MQKILNFLAVKKNLASCCIFPIENRRSSMYSHRAVRGYTDHQGFWIDYREIKFRIGLARSASILVETLVVGGYLPTEIQSRIFDREHKLQFSTE